MPSNSMSTPRHCGRGEDPDAAADGPRGASSQGVSNDVNQRYSRAQITRWVMRTVLGIDAAWTETQPSGVALAEEVSGWRLVTAEISYTVSRLGGAWRPVRRIAGGEAGATLARDLRASDREGAGCHRRRHAALAAADWGRREPDIASRRLRGEEMRDAFTQRPGPGSARPSLGLRRRGYRLGRSRTARHLDRPGRADRSLPAPRAGRTHGGRGGCVVPDQQGQFGAPDAGQSGVKSF